MAPVFALIHSPVVGPFTWELVAEALRRRGFEVLVPDLRDSEESGEPFWKQHAESAAGSLRDVPDDQPLILVGHSGAGALLPAIRQALGRPVAAYLFVDARIHVQERNRLDTFDEPGRSKFRAFLESGGRFPTWTDEMLSQDLPDPALRERVIRELRPRALAYWIEPIPVFAEWPDAPCAYLWFSPSYEAAATRARRAGWPLREMRAGHFHLLVDPEDVADALLELAEACGISQGG